MLAALPNPDQIGSTPFSPPGYSATVKFPFLSSPESGCFQLQLVGLKVDLNQQTSSNNSSRKRQQGASPEGVVGVNLFPGKFVVFC